MFWGENGGFLDCFLGTKAPAVMCGLSKLQLNEIDMHVCFLQKNIIHKTMFVPKVRLFLSVYWFVNLNLTDKHGTKNL